MDMVGLNGQFYQLPALLINDLMDNLLQLLLNRPNQHTTSILGTPDQMIHNEMHTMPVMLVFHDDQPASLQKRKQVIACLFLFLLVRVFGSLRLRGSLPC